MSKNQDITVVIPFWGFFWVPENNKINNISKSKNNFFSKILVYVLLLVFYGKIEKGKEKKIAKFFLYSSARIQTPDFLTKITRP